ILASAVRPQARCACNRLPRTNGFVMADSAGCIRPISAASRPLSALFWTALLLLGWCAYLPGAQAADNLEVEISGVEDQLLDNVRVFLSIVRENESTEKNIPDQKVRALYRQAPSEIKQALQPFGYYQPAIDASLEKKDGVWHARFKIDKGPPTRIRKVEISVTGEGRNASALRKALKSADISTGQILQQQKYSSLKQSLLNTAYEIGYIDAKYSRSQILVNPVNRSAEIYLILDTGPRYYFGKITIEQDILDPDFVKKFVQIKRSDPFETSKLLHLQFALTDSGYFDQVELQANRNAAENQHVPVIVHTTPAKSQRYLASIGYGTDTGPRLRLGIQFPRVTRTGHKFRTDLELSFIKSSLSSQYQIPIGDIASEYLGFAANIERAKIGDATATQYGIGGSLNQNWLGGRRRLSLDFRHEQFSFGSNPSQTSDLLIPGITYSRKVADNPLFTRKGYSVLLDVHGAAQPVLADTSFLQVRASARAVAPWAQRGRLLLRADYGATATSGFSKLPPSQRFFAGGAQSVRGYSYQSLSPENAEGDRIGGRYLLVGSIEADYLLIGNFGAAVFFDAGNATLDPSPNLKEGAGIGLRYRSPVGMVRLDFAHPLTNHELFRIHFSIGPDI
ncbi:MAG TPA: autotransporter assembly complex family protein, partial [Nitrococcus sp.]|nr:autotransporter assembly complex family protein [Nitrococcus sp.]